MTQIRRFADLGLLSIAAADELIAIARDCIEARGTCSIALSGGSTPKRMFQILAARGREALAYDAIDWWWGDERCVPPNDPDSNYGAARDGFLAPLAIDAARIHRMRGEDDPEPAARDYERALIDSLGSPPVLDLVLLGLGADGHTASLFPGTRALDETARFVVANSVPGRGTRLTLTAHAINAARHICFVVSGADKAPAIAGVLHGPPDVYPAQRIRNATWLVDEAAAGELG